MRKITNRLKNVVRFVSPFHSNKVITHQSLQRDYQRKRQALGSTVAAQLDQTYDALVSSVIHNIRHEDGFLITQMKDKDFRDKG